MPRSSDEPRIHGGRPVFGRVPAYLGGHPRVQRRRLPGGGAGQRTRPDPIARGSHRGRQRLHRRLTEHRPRGRRPSTPSGAPEPERSPERRHPGRVTALDCPPGRRRSVGPGKARLAVAGRRIVPRRWHRHHRLHGIRLDGHSAPIVSRRRRELPGHQPPGDHARRHVLRFSQLPRSFPSRELLRPGRHPRAPRPAG